MARPAVTIGMSVHNAARTLTLALRSILQQTSGDWELVVVDDGSTDGTAEVLARAADPRIRVVRDGRNLGLAARLNEIVAGARGELFARMDADDVAYPSRLAAQATFLAAHPEVDLAGCGALVFGDRGEPLGRFPLRTTHEQICADPWSGFYLPHPGWMGRTAWFARNPYRPEYRKTQDQDLLLRTFDSSRFACLSEVLLGYRMEQAPLAKRLRGRSYFARSILREASRRGMYGAALRGVVLQVTKAAADCLAAALPATGLAATRRLGPLTEPEGEAWRALWRTLHT
jgi:glycosyltransferase involved in cell wall biosynthesis